MSWADTLISKTFYSAQATFHSGLLKDLSLILNDADDFNVIIQVGENHNTKKFRAHSVILSARSSYFKSALSSKWVKKENDMIMFNKPNIFPTIFEMILKYIYTGELDLTKQTNADILELLVASDELLLEELLEYLLYYLIENQSTWLERNFVLVLNTVFKLDNCKILRDHCLDFICENPQQFITSKTFPSLDREILFDLLERDELRIEEIVAWDYLIKWGIEQTPYLESKKGDRAKWNDNDFEALKETLHQFIPLIRFLIISSADFFLKVHPYKAIFPNHIYEEVEEFYSKGTLPKTITSSRIGKINDSTIIKPKLAIKIANLICKKGKKCPYKFNLIYRGSRDGIVDESFKRICSGQMASLVLIKVQSSDKIYGGYSSVGFHSINNNFITKSIHAYNWYNSSDNFIFSTENNEDIKHMQISHVVKHSQAILDHYSYGFSFGWASLAMNNNLLFVDNWNGKYENNLNPNFNFTIEEIETFIIE